MPTPPPQSDRRAGSMMALFVSFGAFVLAMVGVVAVASSGPSTKATATGNAEPVKVTLSEFKISPTALTANPGDLTLEVVNAGTQVHDIQIPSLGVKSPEIQPGQSAKVQIPDLKAGTYEVICNIPGHSDAGMKATLTVGGGGGGEVAAGGSMAGMDMGASTGASPDDAKIDFSAAAPDDFKARDPKAPAPLPGTVHDITLETRETELEIAPGVKQQMFTFNFPGEAPTVPAPVLRGKVGDTFNITLVNKGQMAHSIDLHASKVAWNDEMRNIKPGESLNYTFTADYAGAFMYHCGTDPALHHIGNGMYGAILIDPPDLAPVDHEFVLEQSEFYTGPQGKPGNLNKMKNDAWDAVVFNGYVNQYKDRPIRVEPNQRVRVWVLDHGPSENSAFHIVGTVFDTVFKEGSYQLRPDQRRGGAQVLDQQPAGGGFVEFSLAEKGLYPIVTHKFSNVGKGALGLFQAGDVEMPAGGAG